MTARLSLAADLGYQLQLAALASSHAARQELAELQLTPARVTALIHIRDQPGCDQTELGNRLLVNRAAGMKIANALAEQGLIERPLAATVAARACTSPTRASARCWLRRAAWRVRANAPAPACRLANNRPRCACSAS